jgi:hypothetical protein
MCGQLSDRETPSVSRPTFDRFQGKIAEDHFECAPQNDFVPNAFAVATTDNDDWGAGYARVRSTSTERGKHITAIMGIQPSPVSEMLLEVEKVHSDQLGVSSRTCSLHL